MIIGFKVTQSCAEPRVVQKWNLIIEISPEKLNMILLWSYGSSHFQKHLSFQPLILLRVSSLFLPQTLLFCPKLKLFFHYCELVVLADWNIRFIAICACSYLHRHIHPIAHLSFPIYWLTLRRKFSEGTLVITCPTSTDFQNYHFFPAWKLANDCKVKKICLGRCQINYFNISEETLYKTAKEKYISIACLLYCHIS